MTIHENDRDDPFGRHRGRSSTHSMTPKKKRSTHFPTTPRPTNSTASAAPPPPPPPNSHNMLNNSNNNNNNGNSRSPGKSASSELELNSSNSNEFSWPILLAIIPTLGAFFAGSAEIWSDFVMILLILYYVYKWMTVPWSYYESARRRRMIHSNTSMDRPVTTELRRHELIGLIWVLASPAVAGYTLQYSRYFLSDYERYMSSFNVAVFVLAASLKPLSHVMLLLRERTLYLQSEIQINETHVDRLQRKLDLMEDELVWLRHAFATKKDLGQVTDDLEPSLLQLQVAMSRCKEQEDSLRRWSENKFGYIDEKIKEFERFKRYDEDHHRGSTLATLVLLPLNITVWIAKSMTGLLPVPRALLGAHDLLSIPPTDHHRAASMRRPTSGHDDILACPP